MSSNFILLSYVLIWVITSFLYIKKRKCIDAGAILVLSYLLYAISSYLLFNNLYNDGRFLEMQFWPFVYLYLMFIITAIPILKFRPDYIIQKPSVILIKYFSIIYFVCSFIRFVDALPNISSGIMLIMLDTAGGEDLYYLAHEESSYDDVPFYVRIGSAFNNLFSDIAILVLFFYLTYKNRKKYVIFFLLSGVLLTIFNSIAQGLRTVATAKLLVLIATYFLFGDRIDDKIRKKVRKCGLISFTFILFIMGLITISRFGDRYESMSYYFESYAGQGNLYFNNYAFDSGGIRYGDRTCNEFKSLLGYKDVPEDPYKTRDKYAYMKISEKNFTTFVGDFILDFGPVAATIILIVVTFLLRRGSIAHGNKIYFHQLLLIYFCLCVCMQGGMYLFYYSYKGNYTIIAFLLVYLIFRYDEMRKKSRLKLR